MSDDKDNVVTFKGNTSEPQEQEEFILVCMCCDNKTFNLYAGGKITCAFCDVEITTADESDNRAWRKTIGDVDPDTKDGIEEEDFGVRITTQRQQMSTPSFARRQTMKLLADWEKDNKLVMLVGYNMVGEGRHWFNITNEPQREWVVEKFDALFDTVKKMDISSALSEIINPRSNNAEMPDGEDT